MGSTGKARSWPGRDSAPTLPWGLCGSSSRVGRPSAGGFQQRLIQPEIIPDELRRIPANRLYVRPLVHPQVADEFFVEPFVRQQVEDETRHPAPAVLDVTTGLDVPLMAQARRVPDLS